MRALWPLVLAVACGCNTCLDPASIPFAGSDQGMVELDMSSDTTTDVATPDEGSPDASCSDSSDFCESRSCGSRTVVDACGVERPVDCGECGEGGTCGGEGTCSCASGFVIDDGRCADVDECALDTDDCAAAEFCINTPGSWTCSDCPAGQEKNGSDVCVDIDECDRGTDNCDPLVTCTNADPLFVCGDCPAGYNDANGNGTRCDDINECATNVDNCDDNATCTNISGSFTCTCNSGYTGNGISCAPNPATALVEGVQQLRLSTGDSTVSAALAAGTNGAMVVPFATSTNSLLDGKIEAIYVDVWVDGQNRVQVSRASDDGNTIVEVSAVEFGAASVQRGTFSLGTTQSVNIANVDLTKAFVVFSNEVDGVLDKGRDNSRVRASLSASQVTFSRSGATGTASGHFSVVSAATGLTVEHKSLTIPGGTACMTTNTSAPTSRSFLLYSYEGAEVSGSTEDPAGAHAQCDFGGGGVECCRGLSTAPFGADAIMVNVQIITFDAASNGGVVNRNQTIPNPTTVVTLGTPVDLMHSMASTGALGGLGASTCNSEIPSSDEGASFMTVQLLASDEVQVSRSQSTSSMIETRWEVVTWPH